MKTQGSDPNASVKKLRPYQKPVIRDYGSVATLTAGNNGSTADVVMGNMMGMA